MGLILDTNFLVKMEREKRRGRFSATEAFQAGHAGEECFITFTVAAELACGQSAASFSRWSQLVQFFPVLPWTLEISWKYGEIYRALQSKGQLIGANDLWIAATALVHDLGLVTNNVDEFRRVKDLQVLSY